jgi:hypothetical protein
MLYCTHTASKGSIPMICFSPAGGVPVPGSDRSLQLQLCRWPHGLIYSCSWMNFNNDASTHARLEVMFVMWKFLPPLSARTMAAGRNICPYYMSDASPISTFKTDLCSAPCPLPLFFLSGLDQLTRRPGISIRKTVQIWVTSWVLATPKASTLRAPLFQDH